jgi:hypothetical protein
MHLNLGSETSSALDLALCNPGLTIHFEWSILADLYRSNHNPVNLHISTTCPVISQHLNWITGCADKEAFSQSLTFEDWEFPSVIFMVKYFIRLFSYLLHVTSHSHPPELTKFLSYDG